MDVPFFFEFCLTSTMLWCNAKLKFFVVGGAGKGGEGGGMGVDTIFV